MQPSRFHLSDYREHIEAALAFSGPTPTHGFDDIERAVTLGDMQFWPGPHSVIITELRQTPRMLTVHFFLAGGNLAELESMTEPVLEWARHKGATLATLAGRKGWERTFLARTGWTPRLVVFEREL